MSTKLKLCPKQINTRNEKNRSIRSDTMSTTRTRLWTVNEYYRMSEIGILAPEEFMNIESELPLQNLLSS